MRFVMERWWLEVVILSMQVSMIQHRVVDCRTFLLDCSTASIALLTSVSLCAFCCSLMTCVWSRRIDHWIELDLFTVSQVEVRDRDGSTGRLAR